MQTGDSQFDPTRRSVPGDAVMISDGMDSLSVMKPEEEVAPDLPQDPLHALGGMIEGKYSIASMRRRRWEELWYLLLCNMEGFYRNWIPTDPEDSMFFYPKTRQCVVEAQSKILQLIDPPFERVWDLEASNIPFCPWLKLPGTNQQQPSDPKNVEKATDLMRVQIEDDLDKMDENRRLKRQIAQALPLYGTAVIFGPIRHPEIGPRYVNLSAFGDAPLLDQLDAATSAEQNLEDLESIKQGATNLGNGWAEVEDPADKRRPWYSFEPVWNIYPDPDAEDKHKMEYCILRDHYTRSFVRSLLDDPSFIKDAVLAVLDQNPNGDYRPEWWEVNSNGPSDKMRYSIMRYYGFMNAKDFEEMGLDPNDFGATDREACYEIWKSSLHVLKVKRREFQPDKLPFHFIPMEKRDGSPWGRGTAEAIKDLQEVLNSTGRAMHDNLRHCSGVNVVVDMSCVTPGTDLSIRGRKTWPVRRNEFNQSSKPIEAFTLPNNQKELIDAFNHWDHLVPLVCSLPRLLMTNQEMGSGVRTDGMLQMMYEMSETFIKLVVGNIDAHYFQPVIEEMYRWNMRYNPRPGIHGDFSIKAMGVKGAIAREIAGKKALEFFSVCQQIGMPDRLDETEVLKLITYGIGMDGTKAVLGTKDYLAKMQAKLAQREAEKNIDNGSQEKDRAESSVRDVLMQMAKGMDPANPVWPSAVEKVYKQLGLMDERMATGLSIWSKKLSLDYQRAGAASNQEAAELSEPVTVGPLQTAQQQPTLPPGPEDIPGMPMPENAQTAEPQPPGVPPGLAPGAAK